MLFVILELVSSASPSITDMAIGEWHIRYKNAPEMIPFTVELHKLTDSDRIGGSLWRNMKIESDPVMSIDDFGLLFHVDIDMGTPFGSKVSWDNGKSKIDFNVTLYSEVGAKLNFKDGEEVVHEIVLENEKSGTGIWEGNEIILEKRDKIKYSRSIDLRRRAILLVVGVVLFRALWEVIKKGRLHNERKKAEAEKKKDDDANEEESKVESKKDK